MFRVRCDQIARFGGVGGSLGFRSETETCQGVLGRGSITATDCDHSVWHLRRPGRSVTHQPEYPVRPPAKPELCRGQNSRAPEPGPDAAASPTRAGYGGRSRMRRGYGRKRRRRPRPAIEAEVASVGNGEPAAPAPEQFQLLRRRVPHVRPNNRTSRSNPSRAEAPRKAGRPGCRVSHQRSPWHRLAAPLHELGNGVDDAGLRESNGWWPTTGALEPGPPQARKADHLTPRSRKGATTIRTP